MRSYLIALSYLTALPVDVQVEPTKEEVAACRGWFPVVGLFLGLLLAGLMALSMGLATSLVGAFLVLAAWVGLTGGLHLDGLSDLADALAGGATPENRLKILKDPHVGNFGILAIALVLLGKLSALVELLAADRVGSLLAVIAACVMARALLPVLSAGARYPRPQGTGKVLIEASDWRDARRGLILAALAAALVSFSEVSPFSFSLVWLVALWWFCLFWGVSVVLIVGLRQLCQQQLGGVTGDCLGAGIEIVETAFLILAALAL